MKQLTCLLFLSFYILGCTQTKTTIETTDTTITTKIDTFKTDTSVSKIMYLEEVLDCVDLEGLEEKYGAINIIKKATFETGEGSFETTKLFPDTEK